MKPLEVNQRRKKAETCARANSQPRRSS